MTSKVDVLKNIYYDKSGYGSIKTTYEDAKKKDKSIKMNDVKDFFKTYIEQKILQKSHSCTFHIFSKEGRHAG